MPFGRRALGGLMMRLLRRGPTARRARIAADLVEDRTHERESRHAGTTRPDRDRCARARIEHPLRHDAPRTVVGCADADGLALTLLSVEDFDLGVELGVKRVVNARPNSDMGRMNGDSRSGAATFSTRAPTRAASAPRSPTR